MNERLEVVATVAGVRIGEPLTQHALDKLTALLIDDFISMVKHISATKYDVERAKARIIEMVTLSYGHTPKD
jgi:hypothetical protein